MPKGPVNKEKFYYSIRPVKNPPEDDPTLAFVCQKLDIDDFSPRDSYNIYRDGNGFMCNCPAVIPNCRHMKMLKTFEIADKLGEGGIFDYDTGKFIERPAVEV